MNTDAAVEIRNISKTFGAQRALDDVSVRFERGRVTALLGQNGSGKSTIIKILAGFYTPDPGAGQVLVGGEEVRLPAQPRAMHKLGVRFLHQDLAIVPAMSVSDNIALTERFSGVLRGGLIDQRAQDRRVAATLERLGIEVAPQSLMRDLAPADRTMVAIARAFFEAENPTVFLDEPTASLPESEVQKVLTVLRSAVDQGGSIVYVSHRLDEVRQISDDLVILRDGALAGALPAAGRSTSELVELILGRAAPTFARTAAATRFAPALQASGLRAHRLRDVDVTVGRGEIVGITGLIGCGRSELARILTGAQQPDAGAMTLDDAPYRPRSPRQSRARGVGYVPQDRRHEGIVAEMNVAENATLSILSTLTRAGLVRRGEERELALDLIRRFAVQPPVPDRLVRDLSGGNQQKVVFARNAALDLSVLVLDEPTQGIDIGARAEIAETCRALARDGLGIVIASTDFEELATLCDRVIVLDRGRIVDEITGDDITVPRITHSSFASTSPDTGDQS